MSKSVVPYMPDVEKIDPHFDELLEEVVAFWEKQGRESPRLGGQRTSGARSARQDIRCRRSQRGVPGWAPSRICAGHLRQPGQHGALIRFSSTSGHLGPDAHLGTGIGLAMKMFDIPGPKLVDEEPGATTFELVLKNSRVCIANTARHYLFIEEVANNPPFYLARGILDLHQLLSDFLTGKGTLEQPEWAWDELLALLRALANPARHPLLCTFRSMGAMPHGDYIAKIRAAPAPDNAQQNLSTGSDVFQTALRGELNKYAFDFDLQVQLCADLKAMPVNELTVEWPEKLSPFVTVGRIHIPRQDVSGVAGDGIERPDALAFNQWRVTAEHAPLREIMPVRKVYTSSAKVRHALNHQPHAEPTSPAAVRG